MVQDNRDVCPTGWHVPNKDEWDELVNYLDNNEQLVAHISPREVWKESFVKDFEFMITVALELYLQDL